MNALCIATPCIRPQNLPTIADALDGATGHFAPVRWEIVYDLVHGLEAPVPCVSPRDWCRESFPRLPQWEPPFGERILNGVIDSLAPGEWYLQVADDTTPFPAFFPRMAGAIAENPDARVLVFRQEIRDGVYRVARPDTVRLRVIDGGQYAIRGDAFGDVRFREHPQCDGDLIVRLWQRSPDRFAFIDEPGLLAYNRLRPGKGLGWW